jgi:hypothetical protein
LISSCRNIGEREKEEGGEEGGDADKEMRG